MIPSLEALQTPEASMAALREEYETVLQSLRSERAAATLAEAAATERAEYLSKQLQQVSKTMAW
jgi:hypothetical protein